MMGRRYLRVVFVTALAFALPTWADPTVESREGTLSGLREPESKVKVAGQAMAYCTASEECPYTRVLFIGRTPIKFAVLLESETGAHGEVVDLGIQMWNWDRSAVVFEAYWSTTVEYVPSQVNYATYTEWPNELSNLQDSRYRLNALVVNADGSIYDALEIPIFTSSEAERSSNSAASIADWGCVTLQTGKDDGFIDCAASKLNSERRNGNTQAAFGNLRSCLGGVGPAAIVGHGAAGEICTGDGDKCWTSSKVIRHNNGAKWFPLARRVKDRVSMLRLAACAPGAGTKGSDLLYKMAQTTNATVSGPTGFLWCSTDPKKGLWIDGVWKTATPQERPMSLAGESGAPSESSADAVAVIDNAARIVRMSDVEVVAIVLNVGGVEHNVTSRLDLSTDTSAFVGLGKPEVTTSIPAAMMTGRVEVQISLEGRIKSKTYRILANSRLQDTDDSTFYYRLDKLLADRLAELAEELREEE